MTGEERARSATRIDRLAALPVAAGVWLWLKGVAVAAGIAVTAAVTVQGVRALTTPVPPASASATAPMVAARPPSPPPSARTEAETPAVAAPSETTAPLASAASKSSARIADSSPVTSSSAPAPEPTLAREAALLQEAQQLAASSPAEALKRLEVHAAAFPNGQLSLERELLTIDVLHRLGRNADARARAESMLARSKGTIYEGRLRNMIDQMR